MADCHSPSGPRLEALRWTRRRFLAAMGTGAALAVAPSWGSATEGKEDVLARADDRIREHRMGRAVLKLQGPDGQALPAGVQVEIAQTRHKFLFGCNIFKLDRCRTPEDNAAYRERYAGLFNFATLPFYWWSYERQKGQPQDRRTEQIVQWCREHRITTKGHPLAWNFVDPRWLTGTAEETVQLQMKRIERCVKRFQGAVDIWDVVNEATHYDRQQCKQDAPKLTEAISKMGVGPFLREAFQTARRGNPKATLLINDYRTDPAYEKNVISELIDENGGPLYDVIGIQSHMHTNYWGPARTWEVCERFARFGKPLHFTEATVVSGPKREQGWKTTAQGEDRQAELASEFYTVLFAHPAVQAITWWDFSDQGAWQGAPAGLVRDDMSLKPAYERLHNLIKGKWWTRTSAEVLPDGQARLHGFLGDYRVSAHLGDRRLSGQFCLEAQSAAPIEVKLA